MDRYNFNVVERDLYSVICVTRQPALFIQSFKIHEHPSSLTPKERDVRALVQLSVALFILAKIMSLLV